MVVGAYGREIMAASEIVAVTPADADLADGVCKALLVSVAGTGNLKTEDGSIVTGVPLQVGYNPLRVIQVRTGGTATGIFALY